MQTTPLILAALASLSLSSAAQAALIDRGGGLIYDDVLNITWLQNGSYSGQMFQWANAVSWAENLVYFDNVRGIELTGWRLPKVDAENDLGCSDPVNAALHCRYYADTSKSELAHLFYVSLENPAAYTPELELRHGEMGDDFGWVNSGLFQVDVLGGAFGLPFWTSTEIVVPAGATYDAFTAAYLFRLNDGSQDAYEEHDFAQAWAVRDGDVTAAAVNPIPEPVTLALLGLGLAALLVKRNV